MPLSKQAKALYEAALRRKGLQPGKAVRQDPRTFVGPIEMEPGRRYMGRRRWYKDALVPSKTYFNYNGRHQDLFDELDRAESLGLIEQEPMFKTYHDTYHYNVIPEEMNENVWASYENPNHLSYNVVGGIGTDGTKYKPKPYLTRKGELELESRMDEAVENAYKDYLKRIYGDYPSREALLEKIPMKRVKNWEFDKYLDELYPVKF